MRDGQRLPQSTEATHINHVTHRMHHGTCGKKQDRLEEGVSKHVEHGKRNSRDSQFGTTTGGTQCHEHVTELTYGRIGQDSFQIVLRQRRDGGDQGRRSPDTRDYHLHLRCMDEERCATGDQIDPRSHHGGSVNQSRNRSRPFHRVRQPDLQRKLS